MCCARVLNTLLALERHVALPLRLDIVADLSANERVAVS